FHARRVSPGARCAASAHPPTAPRRGRRRTRAMRGRAYRERRTPGRCASLIRFSQSGAAAALGRRIVPAPEGGRRSTVAATSVTVEDAASLRSPAPAPAPAPPSAPGGGGGGTDYRPPPPARKGARGLGAGGRGL